MALNIVSQPPGDTILFSNDPLIFDIQTNSVDPNAIITIVFSIYHEPFGIIVLPKISAPAINLHAIFNVSKNLTDALDYHYPSMPTADTSLATDIPKAQYDCAHVHFLIQELSGTPLHVTGSVGGDVFSIIRGGTSWEQAPTLNFLATEQPYDLRFLTWDKSPITIPIDKPSSLTYLNINTLTNTFDLKIDYYNNLTGFLGTVQNLSVASGTGYIYPFQVPIGFKQIGANLTAYFDDIDYANISLVEHFTGTPLTKTMKIIFDRTYRPNQRYFMYLNSLGGYSYISTFGESESNLQIKQITSDIFIPGSYDARHGNKRVHHLTLDKTIKANFGYKTTDEILSFQELILSKYIWEYITFQAPTGTTYNWLPIIKNSNNIKLLNDNDYFHSITLEYQYAFSNKFYAPSR